MLNSVLYQGDVFDTLPRVPAGSVDCVVTSPPYWNLRSYLPAEHPLKPRELGSEATPAEFVANMVRVFRLVRAAMADHATCWLNIGDSYIDDSKGGGYTCGKHVEDAHGTDSGIGRTKRRTGIPGGNLALIPQRLAIALQDDGWFVRSVVVWHKPAPMPASLSGWQWLRCRVKVRGQARQTHTPEVGAGHRRESNMRADFRGSWADCPGCRKCEPHGGYVLRRGSWRPTSSWEPVLLLAKTANYFADGEPVKTAPAAATVVRDRGTRVIDDPDEQYAVKHDHETVCDGANLRDVWTVAAEPLTAGLCEACGHFVENVQKTKRKCPKCAARLTKHYAAFPTALAEKCLRAGTSARGYCPGCGKPWVRVVDAGETMYQRLGKSGRDVVEADAKAPRASGNTRTATGAVPSFVGAETRTVGWRTSCDCDPTLDPRPGLVLDPFTGSGRTLITARRLGLDCVGCELNPVYVRLANRLMLEDMPLFGPCEVRAA